ncbi:hypothetical protein QTG54_011278 [Skeletonema marinoi]|uniref:Protein kinase domain-containing protein n=1 Tax=Skeletonema marinoi TaxID=267567 RepID=A0AAD9D9N7_9STRA|nr:hypothetical protein QTG54_011278 [Skeletonema marinoi]
MTYKSSHYRLRRIIIIALALVYCGCMPKCDGFASNIVAKPHQNKGVSMMTLSRLVETSGLALALLASTCTDARAAVLPNNILETPSAETQSQIWQLPNGSVELSNPLTSFSEYKLTNPILLGAGGGGAVFATHPMNDGSSTHNNDVAVKISWVRSASSVEHECKVLQELEVKHTRNVEWCVAMETYPPDIKRVMIALQPVVENAVSRVDKIIPDVQPLAVQAIVQTFIDMLHANVVTTDVQTLMDKETGKVLFIDLTEAQTMTTPTPSYLDLALASSFISEIVALVPTSLMDTASKTLVDELLALHSRGEYLSLPIYELLGEQEVLLNPKSAEIIDDVIVALQQQ